MLGSNAARCSALTRIDLSKNSLTDEQLIPLLKGLADSSSLKKLDLSFNSIGESSGRIISNFIIKCSQLKQLNLSQNPILNVTINKLKGQKALEENGDKGGGNKKDKKSPVYVPSIYVILNAIGKSTSLTEVKFIGLVVDKVEWESRIQVLSAANSNVNIVDFVAHTKSFDFSKITPDVEEEPPAEVSSEEPTSAEIK